MRSLVSSSGTDLGVWYSKRHRRWTRVSVHLYYSQLITGVAIFLFTLLYNVSLPKKVKKLVRNDISILSIGPEWHTLVDILSQT